MKPDIGRIYGGVSIVAYHPDYQQKTSFQSYDTTDGGKNDVFNTNDVATFLVSFFSYWIFYFLSKFS